MVRSRSYDEGQVLTGAMHAFRRSGYSGVSIPELEVATGLSAGSIYNSFGDKRGIFLAAFAHYLKAVLDRRISTFAKPANGLSGLRQLFLSLLREPDGETFGCLITNSAIEFGSDDAASEQTVLKGFEILQRLFVDRLAAAKAANRLRGDVDPNIEAVRLLALYQGVLVLIRGGYEPRIIRRAIDLEFDNLEGASDDT
ncbi:MAG TPA: TetR/AcrR family transcriptional regulator [Bradyrhizobium sp.]|nr:TetR/AcrR family transcriptional regulator [Bradyrhizobium sp.]